MARKQTRVTVRPQGRDLERIVEFSRVIPGEEGQSDTLAGGLISFRLSSDSKNLVVELYNIDPNVIIMTPTVRVRGVAQ